jgi:S-adenosylmethionine/arginine decarboxylase-like enzyme
LTIDIWLKFELKDSYIQELDQYILKKFTVLKISKHDFEPIGLTKTYILSESHCAIHTYPENNYFAFDLFICNKEIDLEGVVQDIVKMMPVEEYQINISERGVRKENYLNEEKSIGQNIQLS